MILPAVDVGRNCEIRRAVIDRGCKLPEGLTVGLDPELDEKNGFFVTDGVVTPVTRETLNQEINYDR